MVALKKYNLEGETVGECSIDDAILEVGAHPQMVKDYIIAIRANARQWSASTLGRSEVKHTTKKPHRQKGTGSARQGSLVGPQFRGGGIVFGPKPKFDQHVRINKKERRLAIRSLLAEKIKGGRVVIVEDSVFGSSLEKPKTKRVAHFLSTQKINGRSVLFVGNAVAAKAPEVKSPEEGEQKPARGRKKKVESEKVVQDPTHFKLSLRNIPRAHYALSANVSGYDLVAASYMVMTESALQEMVGEQK